MAKSLEDQVKDLKWFHSIEYAPGKFTPGVKTPAIMAREKEILLKGLGPEGFKGKSVIDIGAWDGYYSFLAADCAAKSVTATDHYCWSGPGWGTKAGFDLLNDARPDPLYSKDIDIPDIGNIAYIFDITLCLGVLYHLKDPLGLIEKLSALTGETLVLETYIDALAAEKPVMVYYPSNSLDGDESNFWGPNPQCVTGMCKDHGFKTVEFVRNPHAKTRGWFFCRK